MSRRRPETYAAKSLMLLYFMFCDRCQLFWSGALAKARIPEDAKRPEDIVWAPHEIILHARMRDLKNASDSRCRICRIVYYTPADFEHPLLLSDHDEPLQIILALDPARAPLPILKVEFREASTAAVRIPRRLIASCIGVLGQEKSDSSSTMRISGSVHHSAGDLATMLDEAARLDNHHTGSDGSLQLASFWIKSCVKTHDRCRIAISSRSPFVPTRLLDVSNNMVRLIESEIDIGAQVDRSYLALSHCWGLTSIIRTVKENYEQHRKYVPPEKLSKTFRDAIHTTRALGFRYIWIDSMCIIQDDSDDWAAEAATMCDVYRYALLTIAAAHAPGGDVGCFHERDGLLNLPFYMDVPSQTGPGTLFRLHFITYGRPQPKDVGGGDPALYGRAWVLQEQLLSPRMLIFDSVQLRWECITLHGSEKTPTSGNTRHSLSHKCVRSGVLDSTEFFSDPDMEDGQYAIKDFASKMKHQHWRSIVMEYTHRGMTQPSDRLAALAGVGQALARHTRHAYLAGLWSDYFHIGLLWGISHNTKFIMNATTNFDIEGNKHIRHKQPLAPSWSWASVTAPVMYEVQDLTNIECVCEIRDVWVSGSVDRQTGQATIHGHVRRGYVNAIYPYSIREAAAQIPHMIPSGRENLEHVTFKDRIVLPKHYFLFSEQNPSPDGTVGLDELRHTGPFRFVRGCFQPDEIVDPSQEITFIAIAQRHYSKDLSCTLFHPNHAPFKVYTLALVLTDDAPGTYRRIGHAVWDECAWYGYQCGFQDNWPHRVTSPREWDRGYHAKESPWEEAYRRLWWDDMEYYRRTERVGGNGKDGRWKHEHEREHEQKSGQLPELKMYKAGTRVEEQTVVIV